MKWVKLLQDRFSRKLAAAPLKERSPVELLAAFNDVMREQQEDGVLEPGIGIEVNLDKEGGFNSAAFRNALETPPPGGGEGIRCALRTRTVRRSRPWPN